KYKERFHSRKGKSYRSLMRDRGSDAPVGRCYFVDIQDLLAFSVNLSVGNLSVPEKRYCVDLYGEDVAMIHSHLQPPAST
ncbi:hypothetical protein Avbf_18786, partial [Armadillidium vulgare]